MSKSSSFEDFRDLSFSNFGKVNLSKSEVFSYDSKIQK
jgi:hypothetical protein